MRKYWYSIFLICSIVIMTGVNMSPNRHSSQPAALEYALERPAVKAGKDTPAESQGQNETISSIQQIMETTGTEAAAHMAEQKQDKTAVNKDFSDTLFIGDSRTVGLSEYGDLGQAVVFANSGMSVFNLLDTKVSLANGDKQKLDQVLSGRNFKTIYLMWASMSWDMKTTALSADTRLWWIGYAKSSRMQPWYCRPIYTLPGKNLPRVTLTTIKKSTH